MWAGRAGAPPTAELDPGLGAIGVEEVAAACRSVCAPGRPAAEEALRAT
ncbi:hypothetical protein [Nocardiopsis sp. RV163]|nr:hypothetical protein [Nocardiopsis sp. RV163]